MGDFPRAASCAAWDRAGTCGGMGLEAVSRVCQRDAQPETTKSILTECSELRLQLRSPGSQLPAMLHRALGSVDGHCLLVAHSALSTGAGQENPGG